MVLDFSYKLSKLILTRITIFSHEILYVKKQNTQNNRPSLITEG